MHIKFMPETKEYVIDLPKGSSGKNDPCFPLPLRERYVSYKSASTSALAAGPARDKSLLTAADSTPARRRDQRAERPSPVDLTSLMRYSVPA
ncbi:hypothetical protein EVAR_48524_1 [Eumeta japonica]|uniref:Uncharacterized protein n=1 Tax=Eumeta variegata TaxID=151549 RepID=A0A4C1Z658_EUMVA|nr:hypothetical protein EVAR_48524_1 [Eumeta japonica]